MARKYDSTRRSENAARTRQAIVEAAVKLHGQGITTLSAVAEEARVSLPTVNKYFPTREDLFVACTRHVAESLDYTLPEELAAIHDRQERLYQIVRHVYTLHEATFGQTWVGYTLMDESPTLARAIADYEGYVSTLVDALLRDWDDAAGQKKTIRGFVLGILNPLTYRALRLNGGLDYEAAVEQTTQVLEMLLGVAVPA